MALTCVSVVFEIGHEAVVRNKKTPEGFTHDWELFVRGAENTDIHHFVDKVVFYLHETFYNPKRIIKEPPYIVRESGYAGFPLNVEIYLKSKPESNKIRYKYQLYLQDLSGGPISNVVREKYVFNNPPEDFRRKLIKGGGVGVGAESAGSSSHTSHMAAHGTEIEHKNSINKSKSSSQDISATKKSKKENIPRNEEELSADDPFSVFGQPINTSKIPLVSKPSSKQISDKLTQPEKQAHSSKPSKHSTSSHKEKERDRDRDKEKEKDREKEKIKDRDKEKDKNQIKKSKDDSMKKEKSKDEKSKILKSSKEDSKKNSYHEEKSKEKTTEKSEKEVKAEKKDKEKKHKEDKKLKSKEKHKNTEKKENIDVKENYSERSEKAVPTKDDSLNKDEKKMHKVIEDKEDKMEKIKEKSIEPKNLYSNGSVNNENVQPIVNSNVDNIKKEEKHKHHKHKKDKSKKDSKRDKEEKKEKLKESKDDKEKLPPAPMEPPKSVSKSDSPKRKRPLRELFDELSNPESDTSEFDEEPSYNHKLSKKEPSPEIINSAKEDLNLCLKQKEPTKEEKLEASGKKRNKKSSEDKESKKRKRKSKDKVDIPTKVNKYENRSAENDVKLSEVQEPATESKQNSLSPVTENIFTDEYVTKLKELQRKIMTLDDNSGLQRIVQVVAETGQYEITTRTFDFDLCTLDQSIVQRLFEIFL